MIPPMDWLLEDSHGCLDTIEISAPAYIGYDIRCLPNDPVASLRERGLPIVGWTVRSHDERHTALMYCDNYIFEHIDPLSQDDET